MASGRVWQEFYCNDCNGYFRVRLNMSLNIRVKMKCPNCGREHPRCIVNGLIKEYAPEISSSYTEEIIVPKSAYSKEPKHTKMLIGHKTGQGNPGEPRDGVEFKSQDDIVRDQIMRERWVELYGGD